MAYYNPLFNRKATGKYDPETSFISIKNGTDAYLLEDEINEMQWMQNEARAELIRKSTHSGYLYVNDATNPDLLGSIQLFSNTYLNSFGVKKSPVILDGFMVNLQENDNRCTVVLPEPPNNGYRHDLVFVEFWYREIKPYDAVHKYGGIENNAMDYEILDSRINAPTSYRVQLQWKIRVQEAVDYSTYLNGFINRMNSEINNEIHPLSKDNSPLNLFNFNAIDRDPFLFIAGDGDANSKLALDSIDGYHYAMPLFMVRRLNNSGYDPRYNVDGGVDWNDENSLSGRPDNHFANIVYEDQIIDLRNLAQIGKFQNDIIYAKLTDVNANYELLLSGLYDLQLLTADFNDFKNYLNNIKIPNIDSQLANLLSLLDSNFLSLQNQIDTCVSRLNTMDIDIDSIKQQLVTINLLINSHNRRLAQIEDILASLGYLSSTQGLAKYSLPVIFIINTSPGVIENIVNGNPVYTQGELAVNATESTGVNSYGVIVSLYSAIGGTDYNMGDLGDYWIEKTDFIYVFRNTGKTGREIDLATVLIDNNITFGGSSNFSGINGTQINRIVANTDLVYIMPSFNSNAKYGEYYIETNATGFKVRNTGEARDSFDWIIIDTTKLTNTEVANINLAGIAGTQKVGSYGNKDEFHVILSTPYWTGVINPGSIGEISYNKINNAVTLYNTGTNVGTVKAAILKQV